MLFNNFYIGMRGYFTHQFRRYHYKVNANSNIR